MVAAVVLSPGTDRSPRGLGPRDFGRRRRRRISIRARRTTTMPTPAAAAARHLFGPLATGRRPSSHD